MSNFYQSDKFLLVDAKTAAKQSDEIKAKLEAEQKEELARKQAEALRLSKIQIANMINIAIEEGRRSTSLDLAHLPETVDDLIEEWLVGLGYSYTISLRVSW
jgi:hypothetical protein